MVSIFCETMRRQKMFLATLFKLIYISSSDPQIDKLCMWTCVDMCIDIYFRTLCFIFGGKSRNGRRLWCLHIWRDFNCWPGDGEWCAGRAGAYTGPMQHWLAVVTGTRCSVDCQQLYRHTAARHVDTWTRHVARGAPHSFQHQITQRPHTQVRCWHRSAHYPSTTSTTRGGHTRDRGGRRQCLMAFIERVWSGSFITNTRCLGPHQTGRRRINVNTVQTTLYFCKSKQSVNVIYSAWLLSTANRPTHIIWII